MSGLYNMVFGVSPAAGVLMTALNLHPNDCGRFRDCYLTSNGEIAVYTRNGGGNRTEYQPVLDQLAKHPLWLRDEDDSFDCTYATVYFKLPEDVRDHILASVPPEQNRNELWIEYLARLKNSKKPRRG